MSLMPLASQVGKRNTLIGIGRGRNTRSVPLMVEISGEDAKPTGWRRRRYRIDLAWAIVAPEQGR